MPNFIRPDRWLTQPRGQVGLNLGSELFSGPVWAVYNAGEIINAINYRNGAVEVSSRNGLLGHVATTAIGVGCDLPLNAASTLPWTLAIVVTPQAVGTLAPAANADTHVGVTEAFNNSTRDRAIGYTSGSTFFAYAFDGASKYNTATDTAPVGSTWCVAAVNSGSQLRVMQAPLGGQSFHSPAATSVSNAGYAAYTTPFFAVGDNHNGSSTGQLHVAFAAYLYGAWTPERFAAWAENPWQVFHARRPILYTFGQAAGTTVNAALTATESADVAALAVTAKVSAALAATESTDVAAFGVTIKVSAALAASESSDAAELTVALWRMSALAATESPDVAALVLQLTRLADLAATESPDTAAFAVTTGGEVATDQPSGGWAAYNAYDAERQRRKRKALQDEEDEREALADRLEAQLASEGLVEPDPAVAQRIVVREYAQVPELLNRRAQRAVDYALRAKTELAWQLAAREIARQEEDEELAVLLLLAAA